jgi:hypothetical protein
MDKITIPYFYIIRHINSNKLYAGSKWGKGCHPSTFMTPNGYKTSSKVIHSIISEEGLESFEILRIDTNLDGMSAGDYETLFLETLNCSKSKDWFNLQNNDNFSNSFNSPETYQKYVENLLIQTGYINQFQIPEVKEKSKMTMITKYGVDNISKSEKTKQKKKSTCLKNHGAEVPLQCEHIKSKMISTVNLIYGVDNVSQSEEIKQMKAETFMSNYGETHYMKTQENRDIQKERAKLQSQIEYTCVCGKICLGHLGFGKHKKYCKYIKENGLL